MRSNALRISATGVFQEVAYYSAWFSVTSVWVDSSTVGFHLPDSAPGRIGGGVARLSEVCDNTLYPIVYDGQFCYAIAGTRARVNGLFSTPSRKPRPYGVDLNHARLALNEEVAALKPKAIDQFSCWAIEGAQRALTDSENPLRLNFFSTAMRILFEHIMDTLSPEDQVASTSWFKPERPGGKPTRWQRVIFAIQGGLSEDFVRQSLQVDLPPLRKRLLDSIDELSKHVHGREKTIIRAQNEQDAVVRRTVVAMAAFLDAMRDCREAVLTPIAEALDEAAIDALLSETIQEVDELASHHSVDDIDVVHITVHTIGLDTITYRVTGQVEVTLQWGANSDVRRGDGVELGQSFPFQCEFQVPLDDPWDLSLAEPTYGVDTGKWRDAMMPEECDDIP